MFQENAFSCILVSDGQLSYVILAYDQVTWTVGYTKNNSESFTEPVWVGFSAGDGERYTSVVDHFSIDVGDLLLKSNVNESGIWIFRVDGNSTVSGGK